MMGVSVLLLFRAFLLALPTLLHLKPASYQQESPRIYHPGKIELFAATVACKRCFIKFIELNQTRSCYFLSHEPVSDALMN